MSAKWTCLLTIATASLIAAPALAQPGRPTIGRGAQPPPVAQLPVPTPTTTAPAVAPPDSQPPATARPATAQPAARTAPGAPTPQPEATPPPAAPPAAPQPGATSPVAVPVRAAPQPVSAAVPVRAAPQPVSTDAPGSAASQPVPTPARGRAGLEPVAEPAPGRGAPQPVAVPGRGAPSPVVATPGRAIPRPPVADHPGFRILRRTPLEFRPFVLADVGSGATAERQLTLPNGKSLTVEAYLSEINAIEQRLNEIGYSLEDLGDSPETATVLEEPALTSQQLGTQSSAIRARHSRRGGSMTVEQAASTSRAKFEQQFATIQAGRTALVQALVGRSGIPGAAGGIEKSWGLPFGDPHSAWVSLDGDFTLDGDVDGTKMEVTQRVRGSLLDHEFEFLSLTGLLTSPVLDTGVARLEFRVLGNTVPVLDQIPGADGVGFSQDGLTSSPVAWTFTNPLSVGGVGMDVEMTLGGLTGVSYFVGTGGGSVVGVVVPFVNVQVGADIKTIDVYVLEAGVAGELVLVDEQLVMAGGASLQYDNEAAKPYVSFDYLAVNNFEALSGDLNIYTCAYVISNWQPKKKCWRKYLWKEDGIDVQDELFSGNERLYLD